jgi:hypothetical protein
MGGGKYSGSSDELREEEERRQARIRKGTDKINNTFDSQFSPEYYADQRDNYLKYARPQLADQYGDASKELTYALARGGNLDSSARGEKSADLQQLYDLNAQKIGDDALSYKSKARSSIEDARSGLINTLNATGDAQQAASSAISRADALSAPPAYSPLSQLFTDFTAGLGTQAALERANYYSGGQTGSRYNTGLFAPKAVSVTK